MRQMPLVEYELPIHSEHLSSSPVFSRFVLLGFLSGALSTIVCLFGLFRLTIVLSVIFKVIISRDDTIKRLGNNIVLHSTSSH
jgi:hypothetical protein